MRSRRPFQWLHSITGTSILASARVSAGGPELLLNNSVDRGGPEKNFNGGETTSLSGTVGSLIVHNSLKIKNDASKKKVGAVCDGVRTES
jgi:hypothetical protein